MDGVMGKCDPLPTGVSLWDQERGAEIQPGKHSQRVRDPQGCLGPPLAFDTRRNRPREIRRFALELTAQFLAGRFPDTMG